MAAISAVHPEKVIAGMTDIVSAIKEMFQAPHIKVIRSCSKLSKVFLASMVHELCKTRIGETTFEKVALLCLFSWYLRVLRFITMTSILSSFP